MNEENYTRTISELAEKFGVKATQIPYHVKKHLSELGDHVYKKPGTTTPYRFDDVGFELMLKILNQAFPSSEKGGLRAEERIEVVKSSYELIIKNYKERLTEQEKNFETRLNDQKQSSFELLKVKDDLIFQLNSNVEQLSKTVEQLSKTLDQQQQLAAISMKNFEIEQSKSQKHGFFSKFKSKKGAVALKNENS